jgi:hypothetical protein
MSAPGGLQLEPVLRTTYAFPASRPCLGRLKHIQQGDTAIPGLRLTSIRLRRKVYQERRAKYLPIKLD